jgi:hypothetical protein
MTALTAPTVKVKRPRQTPAEARAVYAFVTARDKTCRALHIMVMAADPLVPWEIGDCEGRNERHHAFTGTGAARITDRQHVVLLCAFHHRTWAPTHVGIILDWLLVNG